MDSALFHSVKFSLLFLILVPVVRAQLYLPRDHADRRDFKVPIHVKAPSEKILKECSLSEGSRYDHVLKSLTARKGLTGEACSKEQSSPDRTEATRTLLYELRKIREGELYQIEAMNALMYDPKFAGEGKDLESALTRHLCERSNLAVTEEIKEALREKTLTLPGGQNERGFIAGKLKLRNDCDNPKSEVSALIRSGARAAIADFKRQNLSPPGEADLPELNRSLGQLREKCAPLAINPSQRGDSFQQKIKERTRARSDHTSVSRQEESKAAVREIQKKPYAAEKNRRNALYRKEVFPVVVRIFSSPYGRLLADSRFLHDLIGLDLNANWETADFCKSIQKTGKPLTREHMNTAYFGDPAVSVPGVTAITRKNLGELSSTRIPELRERFWTPYRTASFLQREEAKIQQQVAYELLYHSSKPEVGDMIRKNPVFAKIACDSLAHEAFWEKEGIREGMEWAKGIAIYGGIGVGVLGGFFSGGAGWVMAATLSAGLGMGAAGSTIATKQSIDENKVSTIERIQGTQRALADQAGVRDGVKADSKTSRNQAKLTKREDQIVQDYRKRFEEWLAGRTIENGKIISSAKDPAQLRDELLKNAKDERERYLISLAYDLAMTAGTMGLGRGLAGLNALGRAKGLVGLEKIAGTALKMEQGVVGPSDIADAFGSCLILDNCSGVGAMSGVALRSGTANLKRLFSSFKKMKGNGGKSDEDLHQEIAELVSSRSNGSITKEQVLGILKERLKNPSKSSALQDAEQDPRFHALSSRASERKKLLSEFPLMANGARDIVVRNQGSSGTCGLHAACSFLEMNGHFPPGKTLDLQYVDGLRIWERMNQLILGGRDRAHLVREALWEGNHSEDVLDLFASRPPPFIDRKIAKKEPPMFKQKNREKLEMELAALLQSKRSVSEKQDLLDQIMKKYYGNISVNRPLRSTMKEKSYKLIQFNPYYKRDDSYQTLNRDLEKRLAWEKGTDEHIPNEITVNPDGGGASALIFRGYDRDHEKMDLSKEEVSGFLDRLEPVDEGMLRRVDDVFMRNGETYTRIRYHLQNKTAVDFDGRIVPPEKLTQLYRPKDRITQINGYEYRQRGNGVIETVSVRDKASMREQTFSKLNMVTETKSDFSSMERIIQEELRSGRAVYASFYRTEYEPSGQLVYNSSDVGSHSMVIVGAKQNPDGSLKEILLLNSWGPQSGRKGFYSIPWTKEVELQLTDVLIQVP